MSEQASREVPRTSTFNILFVCTGNTCRSPLAEGIARQELARRGWRHVQVASAGVAAHAGGGAAPQAVAVAAREGVDLSGHRSQPVDPGLLEWADLILVMSPSHLAAIHRLGGVDKLSTLGDFVAGGEGLGVAVRDPFGGSEAEYEETSRELRALISTALDRLAPILYP